MHQTTVTTFAPPLRVDLTMTHSFAGNADAVSVTISGASVLSTLEEMELPAPLLPWLVLWWRPWLRLVRLCSEPFLPLGMSFPYAVTVTASRPAPVAEAVSEPYDTGVVLEAEFCRVD